MDDAVALAVRHYYHLYAAGEWRQPAAEHFAALNESGLDSAMQTMDIGVVGPREARGEALRTAASLLVMAGERSRLKWAEAEDGWEQFTLAGIYADALASSEEYAVLYCHTKGAGRPGPSQDRWRQAMTTALVTEHEKCLALLDAGCDQVGVHRYERLNDEQELVPFWGGNFWWAKASYLRTLGEPGMKNRYAAETWVRPYDRWYDVLPGPVNY